MKKFWKKEYLTYILMFVGLFLLSLYTHIYTVNIVDMETFGFTGIKYNLLWMGFSISWVIFFLLIIYLVPKNKKIIVYDIILVLLSTLFFIQICHAQQLGKFMKFTDIFSAGEGIQYIKSVFLNLNIGMVLICVVNVGIIAFINHLNGVKWFSKEHIKDKKNKRKLEKKVEHVKEIKSKKIILLFIIAIVVFRLISYVNLGKLVETNDWQENYNVRNIYNNYTNPNAAMLISGFYEYNFRAVYKYFYDLLVFDKLAVQQKVDDYNLIYGIERIDNEMTGVFKGKNVIYILMESIDSWIIDEETMPTLYKMMNEGINFTNRYSPSFNGGQTINSEFAFNTGLYAISDKETIYDIDTVDYKYSIANMLKKNGYITNSFHANTSTFYNRGEFHKLLGYTRHYSALDMQRANILEADVNYFSDSALVSDDYLFDLIVSDDLFFSFITTYSAHLEYIQSNKVFKYVDKPLDHEKYEEEEYIYRTLAADTDKMLSIIVEKLKQAGKLDDTIIVLASDHYVYGYSDADYVAIKKDVQNERNELQKTPFVIWGSEIQGEDVDIILDTADILPTMLNLLGIDYNPNMYMGTDVFSENHDHFVWFQDGTYIKDKYATISHEAILTKTNNNIRKNKSILLTNYYGK